MGKWFLSSDCDRRSPGQRCTSVQVCITEPGFAHWHERSHNDDRCVHQPCPLPGLLVECPRPPIACSCCEPHGPRHVPCSSFGTVGRHCIEMAMDNLSCGVCRRCLHGSRFGLRMRSGFCLARLGSCSPWCACCSLQDDRGSTLHCVAALQPGRAHLRAHCHHHLLLDIVHAK